MSDYFLDRFADAQASKWKDVVAELSEGRKRTHWMWFVFPQLKGLGRSATAALYGIDGLREAKAFLAHPLLRARLEEVCRLLLALPPQPIARVLGSPDDLKLRSSMTLFAAADPEAVLYRDVLDRYFGGEPDPATLALLKPAHQ